MLTKKSNAFRREIKKSLNVVKKKKKKISEAEFERFTLSGTLPGTGFQGVLPETGR